MAFVFVDTKHKQLPGKCTFRRPCGDMCKHRCLPRTVWTYRCS